MHQAGPQSQKHAAPTDRTGAALVGHAPEDNRLLATLPLAAYERLLPDLQPVDLPKGLIVHGSGDREQHLYFLTSGIVSRFCLTESGELAEFAVTGNEGVIGIASFLGGESTPSQAVVVSAGYAYRLALGAANRELARDDALLHSLLHYTQALLTQVGQIAVCNRHHSLEQRLCRWILSSLDRLRSNQLALTQAMVSELLGVRRESVTDALGHLQSAGLLHSARGQIEVLDRPALEARACECYAVIKHEYDRLLPRGGHPGIAWSTGMRSLTALAAEHREVADSIRNERCLEDALP